MFDFLKPSKWSGEQVSVRSTRTIARDSYRLQAENCIKAGNFEAAEGHLQKAIEEEGSAPRTERVQLRLELAEVQRKKAAPELARDPEGNVQSKRAILLAAERTVRTAIEIATAAKDSDPGEFVVCMDALADVFADAEDFGAVETVQREALRLGASLPHPDLGLIAARTQRLAVAIHHNGRPEEALKQLTRSMEMHERRYGAKSLEMAGVLIACGAIFRAQGDHERAGQCLQRALRIHESVHGLDSLETFADMQQLARVLEESGDMDGAAFQYERALLAKMRKLGFGNLEEIAEMQYHLANLYIEWGNLARARELLEEAVGEFRRHGGPRAAVAFELLAQVEENLGHFSLAVDAMEKAGTAWERCQPARTMELIRNLEYRADLLDQLRRTKDAEWLRQKIAELQTTMTAQAS